MEESHSRKRNYDNVASFYETTANVFSFGQIARSKEHAARQVQRGERVLFLGVGSGEEVATAIRNGAEVLCVDLSQQMLDRLETRLEQDGLTAELVCANAHDYRPEEPVDAVCANYFLNVFVLDDLKTMLDTIATLIRPGGRLMIADVAPATGNPFYRAFNVVYLKFAMFSYWLLGLVPLHRNYDYTQLLPAAGFQCKEIETFRLFPGGPVVFRTITATRGEKAPSLSA